MSIHKIDRDLAGLFLLQNHYNLSECFGPPRPAHEEMIPLKLHPDKQEFSSEDLSFEFPSAAHPNYAGNIEVSMPFQEMKH